MNRKQNLFDVLDHKTTSQIPWVPFAGVHVGKLKGYPADEVLQDGQKLLDSLLEANRLYAPDGQPVIFDLQIEAEILGCELLWVKDSPPMVVSHPLQNISAIPATLPTPKSGRLPMILDVMRAMKTRVGQHTALYGLISGPFTLASHLRGTDIFMDMTDNPAYVADLLQFTNQFAQQMAKLYVDAGMDVISVVDPMVSQISPRHFQRFMKTPFTALFDTIRSLGVYSAFFVCGNASKNLQGMSETSPDAIAVDENIDMQFAQNVLKPFNIVLLGNIPLTTCMLLGKQEDNMQYVLDLLDKLDHHNLIISPGCDMPYDTPPENVIGIAETIRNPQQTRQILANYRSAEIDLSSIQLPDYANLERPLMEVFTLDSASCAACGYMLAAAARAAETMQGSVDMLEYKMTSAENIARMKKMGVQNLPAILINGQLKFSSLIPTQQALLEALRQV